MLFKKKMFPIFSCRNNVIVMSQSNIPCFMTKMHILSISVYTFLIGFC